MVLLFAVGTKANPFDVVRNSPEPDKFHSVENISYKFDHFPANYEFQLHIDKLDASYSNEKIGILTQYYVSVIIFSILIFLENRHVTSINLKRARNAQKMAFSMT